MRAQRKILAPAIFMAKHRGDGVSRDDITVTINLPSRNFDARERTRIRAKPPRKLRQLSPL